jgi:hypothetical protein
MGEAARGKFEGVAGQPARHPVGYKLTHSLEYFL